MEKDHLFYMHAINTFQSFVANTILTPMQLAFVVFTGEAWGYLGSRRFLLELDMHSDAVHGLNNSQIEMVYFCSYL